jgi:hypothetical protein
MFDNAAIDELKRHAYAVQALSRWTRSLRTS